MDKCSFSPSRFQKPASVSASLATSSCTSLQVIIFIIGFTY
jgi:hypothetical protein